MLTVGLLALAIAAAGPPLKVTAKRDDDRVAAKVEKGVTVIDVRSAFGISGATVERAGDSWPEAITLRLHLTGLESFKATCGKAMLSGFVNGSNKSRPIRLTVGGKEPPQGPDDPFFLDFKAVGKDGKPAQGLPLKDGYFEMRLPKAFLEGNTKSFKLEWVDWYRR
jgi:hypothetical protein